VSVDHRQSGPEVGRFRKNVGGGPYIGFLTLTTYHEFSVTAVLLPDLRYGFLNYSEALYWLARESRVASGELLDVTARGYGQNPPGQNPPS